MRTLEQMDVNNVARAIEENAGQALPGLRESLAQAKASDFAQVHTPSPPKRTHELERALGVLSVELAQTQHHC